jgi:hypothetical protein
MIGDICSVARKVFSRRFLGDACECTQTETGSQSARDAFDFAAPVAEVEQKVKLEAACFDVVDAFGTMVVVQDFDGFQFNQQR